MKIQDKQYLAYMIGLAIGDGNLSNPNGRAVRLRITCDNKYPNLITSVVQTLRICFPENKVSIIQRPGNCTDVYVYSNKLEKLLGWKAKGGPKHIQKVAVPSWIKKNRKHTLACLRGLFQTDGSIYTDRGYKMVNFVTVIPELAADVVLMTSNIGFPARCYKIMQKPPQIDRYNIRVSKHAEEFIELVGIVKD